MNIIEQINKDVYIDICDGNSLLLVAMEGKENEQKICLSPDEVERIIRIYRSVSDLRAASELQSEFPRA
jgi:predicted ATPase with chaperone activity